ncbi:hypothetical protein O3P69_014315 [Scylla paramamosain]|uniref:Uncharacterized protein n=1 Tax=Scylla paramamosain TaxID=85552 RepID=A0AAW0TBJ9_SCYPA
MSRGCSAQRIQAFEKESGYQLYQERYLQQVRLKKLDYSMTGIKARCTRQTNQNKTPYEVWMIASSTGDSTAGCVYRVPLLPVDTQNSQWKVYMIPDISSF